MRLGPTQRGHHSARTWPALYCQCQPSLSLTHAHRLTHISETHRAPGKRQVGIYPPSQMEGLPPPPSTFLPKLPQLRDQKRGLAHTSGLGLKCHGQFHGPSDPTHHCPTMTWRPGSHSQEQGLMR